MSQICSMAWIYHLKPAGYNGRPRLVEAIPIVIGNTMYIGSRYGEVIALNATTGAREMEIQAARQRHAGGARRRLLAGRQGLPASIIFGSRMGRLYSLERRPAAQSTAFGDHGMVNLKTPEVMQRPERSLQPAVGAGDLQESDHHRRRHRRRPGGANGGAGPPAIPAPGTPGPASWSGPSTPCRGRAKSAMTPGSAEATIPLRRQCLGLYDGR